MSTIKHRFSTIAPRLVAFCDEEGMPAPSGEMDMTPEMMEAMKEFAASVMGAVAKMKASMAESEGAMKAAEEKAEDMAGKVDGMKADMEKTKGEMDKMKAERDAALEALAPLKAAQDKAEIEKIGAVGGLKDEALKDLKTPADARRKVVFAKFPHLAKREGLTAAYVAARFEAIVDSMRDDNGRVVTDRLQTPVFGQGLQSQTRNAPIVDSEDPGKAELAAISKRLH